MLCGQIRSSASKNVNKVNKLSSDFAGLFKASQNFQIQKQDYVNIQKIFIFSSLNRSFFKGKKNMTSKTSRHSLYWRVGEETRVVLCLQGTAAGSKRRPAAAGWSAPPREPGRRNGGWSSWWAGGVMVAGPRGSSHKHSGPSSPNKY